uniref:Glutathione synthetase n=1 Tax=Ciona savignyi TaxID=51511 RepID=H2ZCI3_CIOSA
HASFTLFPSIFPKSAYDLAWNVQNDMHSLMHKVSKDAQFLEDVLKSTIAVDDFVKNLFEIYKLSCNCEMIQKRAIGVFRSDYMLQTQTNDVGLPKQIEVNTMASSLMGIGTNKLLDLHKFNLLHMGGGSMSSENNLPRNNVLDSVAETFVKGWNMYGNPNAVFVFMLNQNERNVFDQRAIEHAMYKIDPAIKVRRKVFNTCAATTRVDADGKLFIDNEEVAVVYYRTGYMPGHYPTKKNWEARKMIELSTAVKSPSVAQQLVGSKKIQQVLAQPGVLEHFIDDKNVIKNLRAVFAGLYSLEMNSAGDGAVKLALERPENFVLKPQREGGGNNLYGADLVFQLNNVGGDERRCAYILMEKIQPPVQDNYIVHNHEYNPAKTVSELGIFGVFLTDGDKMINSCTVGHLLRSKSNEHDDGGVGAGVAVLDSPFLV